MNVDAMLRSISLKQFYEWMAFAELEPFDETRDDLRAASIRQTMVELRRDPQKRSEPFKISDFAIPFGDTPRIESVEPKPQGTPWQTMKWYAAQHAAIANAEEDALKKRRR